MAGNLPTILADENIALVQQAFAPLGRLRTVAGRSIAPAMLRDVDVLLVRSITQVDAALLAGSPCRFVGTATSGTDHVDQAWLRQQGITFADAHGCNAEGVVDYVLAALATLARQDGRDWRTRSIGIIGCGAVGSRLAGRALALGMRVCIHDPFLAASHPLAGWFAPLRTVLQQDVVSLHTPLTQDGPWPTFHLLDARTLQLLQPTAVLINAARGAVVDSAALLERMEQAPLLRVVLDAWEGEPCVSQELLKRVALGTPHIAGYSHLGKLRGTVLLRDALQRHLGLPPAGPLCEAATFNLPVQQRGSTSMLDNCILQAFDLTQDHAAMQSLIGLEPEQAAAGFDRLRKQYRERAEFSQFTVVADGTLLAAADRQALQGAGFRVE